MTDTAAIYADGLAIYGGYDVQANEHFFRFRDERLTMLGPVHCLLLMRGDARLPNGYVAEIEDVRRLAKQ